MCGAGLCAYRLRIGAKAGDVSRNDLNVIAQLVKNGFSKKNARQATANVSGYAAGR